MPRVLSGVRTSKLEYTLEYTPDEPPFTKTHPLDPAIYELRVAETCRSREIYELRVAEQLSTCAPSAGILYIYIYIYIYTHTYVQPSWYTQVRHASNAEQTRLIIIIMFNSNCILLIVMLLLLLSSLLLLCKQTALRPSVQALRAGTPAARPMCLF